MNLVISGFAQQSASLKDTYQDAFLIGTALNRDQILGEESAVMTLVKTQFNALTAENCMKWEKIHPKPGQFEFEAGDAMLVFAKENDMAVIGHTLIWHSQTPRWVFQDSSGETASRALLLERMKEHIQTVAGHYKGRVLGWDVVNEALDDDGQKRSSPWLRIIGEDYIQFAFQYAHEADPEAELYYNDYNMWKPGKVDGTVRLIKELQDKGIPIHGIGLQGHWGLDYPMIAEIEAAFRAFAEAGMKIMITEMDVDILPQPSNYRGADISRSFKFKEELNPYAEGLPDSMQQVLSDRYVELFRVFYKYRDSVSRITFWGVDDGHSWKNDFPVRGRTNYPLLFDRQAQPKPALQAVLEVARE